MKGKTTFFLNILLLLISACGYHVMGTGGDFPGKITTLAISPLENRTKEANLGTTFVAAFRREFISRRELDIVGTNEAEAILKGTIRSFSSHTLSYDEQGRVREYRINMTIDLFLANKRDGSILWRANGIMRSEEYLASSDVVINEERKNRAIRKMASDLAEELYLRIREGF
jgi:outer membrane lipopolysaccharide assembly protein LptE/RlpB